MSNAEEDIQRADGPPVYVGKPVNQEPPSSRCECNNCPTCRRPR